MDSTATSLIDCLQKRLADVIGANFTESELLYALNIAYVETVLATGCHKTEKSVDLVADQAVYDFEEMYEPVHITVVMPEEE